MKISIIGTGEVGRYYAEHWSQAGHELVLAYYRDPVKVETFAARLGKNVAVASPQNAAAQADAILFCPRFEHLEDAANQMGDIGEVILIDPNNPFNPDRSGPANLHPGQTAANLVMELATQAHLAPMLSGSFATAALSEFPGPLFGIPYTTDQARKALEMALRNFSA